MLADRRLEFAPDAIGFGIVTVISACTRPLSFKTFTKQSAKSEGVICPVALWRGLGCYVFHLPAQPKHKTRPFPLWGCFLRELLFQADLEPFRIGSLGFGCGWVQEHRTQSSQLPTNRLRRARTPGYRHLPDLPSNYHALDIRSLTVNRSCVFTGSGITKLVHWSTMRKNRLWSPTRR